MIHKVQQHTQQTLHHQRRSCQQTHWYLFNKTIKYVQRPIRPGSSTTVSDPQKLQLYIYKYARFHVPRCTQQPPLPRPTHCCQLPVYAPIGSLSSRTTPTSSSPGLAPHPPFADRLLRIWPAAVPSDQFHSSRHAGYAYSPWASLLHSLPCSILRPQNGLLIFCQPNTHSPTIFPHRHRRLDRDGDHPCPEHLLARLLA
jgi:hypothetical protein